MRAVRAAVIVIVTALATATAGAEDAGVSDVAVAGEVRWERPPAGSVASGALGVPAWVVVATGVVIALGAAGALSHAARRARRRGAP
jgi:hypothetical protein